jgi:starch synthase
MPTPLKILFLASEADPFVKVGGLGDVAGSLPKALRELDGDLDVRLVIPFHTIIRPESLNLQREAVFTIMRAGEEMPVQVFRTDLNGLPVYLVSGGPFSQTLKVYDTDAAVDGEKFIFFTLAALELTRRIGWRPDIVHANDWHTAIAPYAIRRMQDDPFWKGVKTMLSVHNLCFMGAGTEGVLDAYGLPPVNDPALPWWGQHVPLPMGLWAADEIVAVSPSYAEEIQTPDYGCGLETFLFSRHENIAGIVNGIDLNAWNPSTDAALIEPFSVNNLGVRAATKKHLQAQFGLEVNESIPLLAMITRMDRQKGVDIAIDALRLIPKLCWQAILLGTGNPEIESNARSLESDFPARARAIIRFDAKLSRQIYGGADMLLMPSLYEPCGLAQLIAMHYGAVPVARATGGLRDTIADKISGYLFTVASPVVMVGALRRAIKTFEKPEAWQALQKAGMSADFSWQASARQYADLYQTLLSR